MISCKISFDVCTYELISKRIENGIDEHEVYSVQMQKKKVMKENSTILIVRVLCSIVLILYHTDCYNITVKNFGKIDSTELSNCYLERKG